MASLAPLTRWQFGEVFVDEDKTKFDEFMLGVRISRQKKFGLRMPRSGGGWLLLCYEIPGAQEHAQIPEIMMADNEEAKLPEDLMDLLTFDLAQTNLFSKPPEI